MCMGPGTRVLPLIGPQQSITASSDNAGYLKVDALSCDSVTVSW